MALLGIDLRKSAVKVIVLDTEGRSLSISDGAGSHARITAISLSGQMHGVVPTDKGGRPTRAALLWADTRAEEELKRYQALPPALLRQLANPLVPGMAGPLVCWLADHEPVAHQATRWARAEEM
jgi:xylulokinase